MKEEFIPVETVTPEAPEAIEGEPVQEVPEEELSHFELLEKRYRDHNAIDGDILLRVLRGIVGPKE